MSFDETIRCPACGRSIDPILFNQANDFYIRCPTCQCAVFKGLDVSYKPDLNYEIELPDGTIRNGSPYTVIGNYIDENAKKDWKLDFLDDIFAVMSFNKDINDGYFYDRYSFESEYGARVWEHDWHEGEKYVKLVGYVPFCNIADFVAQGIILLKG